MMCGIIGVSIIALGATLVIALIVGYILLIAAASLSH